MTFPLRASRLIALIVLSGASAIACTRDDARADALGEAVPAGNGFASADKAQPDGRLAPVANARSARTHCGDTELPVFSCVVADSDSIVSLCAAAEPAVGASAVRLVAGRLGRPDIDFTHDMTGEVETHFERTRLGFAGNTGGYAYSAGQGDEVHVLYSISGANGLERQGVMVTDRNVERALSDRACAPGSVIESNDPTLLRRVASWPAQSRLEKSGLPPATP